MARKASSPEQVASPRDRVVDALMALAAEREWADIPLETIAEQAGLGLADLRDLFPSKGAMLGGFVRRIDRITLEGTPADLIDQPARDRVLDLMLRRFDALRPYRHALRSIHRAFRGDVPGLLALNQQALNSWRYLLASVGIETEGPMGLVKLQGAILVFARVMPVFLDENDETLPKTMAALDRELSRGEWVLRRAEGLDRLMAPLRGFCRAAKDLRRPGRDSERDAA
ncbi:MAG: TetR/AcrR family transcriptional regulator [Beijerinckiaceae bacterium]|nr:TetR/AcrR family transcriptional regulator [Beijerinckiaceae bacterium]